MNLFRRKKKLADVLSPEQQEMLIVELADSIRSLVQLRAEYYARQFVENLYLPDEDDDITFSIKIEFNSGYLWQILGKVLYGGEYGSTI